MYIAGKPAAYAAQILLGLFATNSAFPTNSQVIEQSKGFLENARPGYDNHDLMRSRNDIAGALRNTTIQAAVPYTVPDTAITLNFTRFGFRIPVVRMLSTIYEARQQVLSDLASDSENATRKDRFEYSTHSTPPEMGVCSIAIQVYRNLGLSWVQIDQILKALMEFSSGAGVDRQFHYQALQFEVSLSHEGRIGVGLLWYTPIRGRGVAEVVKRVENPARVDKLDRRLNLVSGPVNKTSLLSNEGNPVSSSAAEVSFPVLGTNISLTFVWLGNPIPSEKLNDVLHGAFLEIAPFLKESANEPIPNGRFFYAKAAGKAEIAIQIYGMITISWSQVNSVMIGLYRFTNGIGTVHEREYFKNLGFDVKDENGLTIGYGNLLGVSNAISATTQRRSTLPSKPLNTLNTTILPLPHPSHALSNPYIWPIPNTDFTLTFTYLGAALPPFQTEFTMRTAVDRTRPHVALHPNRPIDEIGFENHIGNVQIYVIPYEGSEVSWWQLFEVLNGLLVFLAEREPQLMVFDIEVKGHGRIGSGTLWFYEGPPGGDIKLVE